ncbi:hypothetical protein GCM10018966_006870 [Streptomyces yanii]
MRAVADISGMNAAPERGARPAPQPSASLDRPPSHWGPPCGTVLDRGQRNRFPAGSTAVTYAHSRGTTTE